MSADADVRATAGSAEECGPYRATLCHLSGRWLVEREYGCINGLSAWFAVATLNPADDESAMGYTDGAIGTAEDRAKAIVAALNRSMAALAVGEDRGGWSFDMAAAPRDKLIRVAKHMGCWGWILGTARWHGGGLLSGWISRGVGGPGDGLGLADPDCWAPFDPPDAPPLATFDAPRPAAHADGGGRG